MKKLIASASMLSLIAMPVAASAAPVATNSARSLSVSPSVRAGTSTARSNKLAGGGASIIPLLIGAGIIAGATYLIIDHEDDKSDSN
ncbi:hypothetical protein [Sphingomonas mollis]|uniref:Uncharacterized protein n=1 Tax=Sphingomonas mollis TaxID=2795726 RepID=A0ABS0XTD9_9SPHN|nr:hypothetical protein [Sphingomonas sp. BT553]MBJ6123289.1 hypothetical protein [Sphingomonas sp. BT553]